MSLDDMALQAELAGEAHVTPIQGATEEELLSHGLGLLVSLLMHVQGATGCKPCVASWTGIRDKHYEHDGQRKRTKYTVPILPSTIAVVVKGTFLYCYYVKISRTGGYACHTCSTHCYIMAVKGCSFVYHSNC